MCVGALVDWYVYDIYTIYIYIYVYLPVQTNQQGPSKQKALWALTQFRDQARWIALRRCPDTIIYQHRRGEAAQSQRLVGLQI